MMGMEEVVVVIDWRSQVFGNIVKEGYTGGDKEVYSEEVLRRKKE